MKTIETGDGYGKNIDKVKEYNKQYYLKTKEKHNEQSKKWREQNKEREYELHKLWRKEHPGLLKQMAKKANAKKRNTSKKRLACNVSLAIWLSLKKNSKTGRHWEDLVGYNINQLKKRLEKQFKKGMAWDNYGIHGWHIDHIIPVSVFNFESPDNIDFKKCWALENLRPLWAKENIVW